MLFTELFLICSFVIRYIECYEAQFIQQYGVLLEPDRMIVSYDDRTEHIIQFSIEKLNATEILKNCNSLPEKSIISLDNYIKTKLNLLMSLIPQKSFHFVRSYCKTHSYLCSERVMEGLNNLYSSSITQNDTLKTKILPDNQNRLPEMRKSYKKKRYVAPILAGAGLALSLYSSYKVTQAGIDLDEIRSQLAQLKLNEVNNKYQIHQIVDWNNKAIHKVSSSLQYLQKEIQDTACSRKSFNGFTSIASYMNSFESDVESLINMINGRVDFRIFSSDILTATLNKDKLLDNSIYHKEPGLIYQVASSALLDSYTDPYSFKFLISIPIIKEHMYSPLYHIFNGGWEEKGIIHKLLIPKSFYLFSPDGEKTSHAIEMTEDSCYKGIGITICDNSRSYFSDKMRCLNNLLRNSSDHECDLILRKEKTKTSNSKIFKTKTGLFFYGVKEYQKMETVGSHLQYMTRFFKTNSYTNFIPYSDFVTIFIDDLVIKSQEHRPYVIQTNLSIGIHIDINYPEVSLSLEENSELKLSDIRDNPSLMYQGLVSAHSSFGVSIIIDIILILLIVILVVVLIKLRRSFSSYRQRIAPILLSTLDK